jgi:S-DNA-T family DNA segregation ATPase FtsK/SpoIIIE
VDVLTGIIKANFPARLSFQVASRTDSRTILDAIGAERLLGKGDMLFLPPGTSKLLRIHGAYVSEAEVKRLVHYLRKQYPAPEAEALDSVQAEGSADPLAVDDQYAAAVALVARRGRASAALIQHDLQVSSERARDLLEALARQGVISHTRGKRRRQASLEDLSTPL